MARKPKDNFDLVMSILEAAERHGQESEMEMEAGDLGSALQIVWKMLTPQQRQDAYNEIVATLGWDEED